MILQYKPMPDLLGQIARHKAVRKRKKKPLKNWVKTYSDPPFSKNTARPF